MWKSIYQKFKRNAFGTIRWQFYRIRLIEERKMYEHPIHSHRCSFWVPSCMSMTFHQVRLCFDAIKTYNKYNFYNVLFFFFLLVVDSQYDVFHVIFGNNKSNPGEMIFYIKTDFMPLKNTTHNRKSPGLDKNERVGVITT